MGGFTGGGYDDAEALLPCGRGELLRGGGRAVGGDDVYLKGDAERLQAFHAGAHGIQVAVRAHDDGNFFAHTDPPVLKCQTIFEEKKK